MASKGSEKLSKTERKLQKRQNKAQATLLRHDGICTLNIPSMHLVVFNGGLGNGVCHDELEVLFRQHGQVLEVSMQPDKPYAFVSYSCSEEAEQAMKNINGRELRAAVSPEQLALKLFLAYVEKVPGVSVPDNSLPPGLVIIEDAVNESYEAALLACLDWENVDPNIKEGRNQDLKHRRVKHYGYEFLYSINNIDPGCPLTEPVPEVCHAFLDRLLEQGHVTVRPDQLTVNQYEPGQGIPPHIDTHSACEDGIISLSLGAQVVMDFRHPDGRHIPVLLPRRSAIVMTGESRYVWSHGITPRKSDIVPLHSCESATSTSLEDESSSSVTSICDSSISPHDTADVTKRSNTKLTMVKRCTRTSFTFRRVLHGPCKCKFPQHCDSQMENDHGKTKPKKTTVAVPLSAQEAVNMEKQHVHKVYEEIAGHFSDTRHTPWPRVVEFMKSRPDGALVVDVGCGNGKYLGTNSKCFILGCDRSSNLCGICAERGHQAFVCDALAVPLRAGIFDAAISIAVIHHLSTHERRLEAVKSIVSLLCPGGQALIYVWAYEQERNKVKSTYLTKGKKSGEVSNKIDPPDCAAYKDGGPVDGATNSACKDVATNPVDCHQDISAESSSVSCPQGTGGGHDLKVHKNRTNFEAQDLLVPWHLKGQDCKANSDRQSVEVKKADSPHSVFHRYYHVFQEGELEQLCLQINDINIVTSYYDQGNWCVILEKVNR